MLERKPGLNESGTNYLRPLIELIKKVSLITLYCILSFLAPNSSLVINMENPKFSS